MVRNMNAGTAWEDVHQRILKGLQNQTSVRNTVNIFDSAL